jgi:hypothetical protein
VTTPNVTSALSRTLFVRSGRLAWFHRAAYHSSGHITILPWWLLEEHARSTDWEVIECSFGSDHDFTGKTAWLKKIIKWAVGIVGYYSSPEERTKGCSVFVLKAPAIARIE